MLRVRTVELCAGIGGFRIAANALGWETVLANDQRKEAMAVYRQAFGDDRLMFSVPVAVFDPACPRQMTFFPSGGHPILYEAPLCEIAAHIPAHEVLTAGFPCQPFSQAGKKQGFADPRSSVFQQIADVIARRRPKLVVLENVPGLLTHARGATFARLLCALTALDYAVEWRILSATAFGLPQARHRLFIVARPTRTWAALGFRLAPLADLRPVHLHDAAVLYTADFWNRLERPGAFASWGLAYQDRYYTCPLNTFADEKTPLPLALLLEKQVAEDFYRDASTKERLKQSTFVNRINPDGVHILYSQQKQGYTVFGTEGFAPCLTAATSRSYERYKINGRYRRLTPREYARLQGFADDHCAGVFPSLQYQLIGNAVPPPMARWVLRRAWYDKPLWTGRIAPPTPKR